MRKERGRKQAVRFSPRSEGKRGDNVQTKGYYGTKGNVVLLYICSAVVRTRINGFTVKKKKFRQEVSAEKGIRKYFLRERMVK